MRIATPIPPTLPDNPHSLNARQAMRNLALCVVACGPLAVASCTGQGGPSPSATVVPSSPPEGAFDGQRAYEWAVAQVELGPRVPGSEAHAQGVALILRALDEAGWQTETQTFAYGPFTGINLIGRAGPTDSSLVLLGAHYDSRPRADRDAQNPDQPVPGANDGASGVAVLLELARVLSPQTLASRVWLVFFDAEDGGGLNGQPWIAGSTAFAATLTEGPEAIVIVDMVGDRDLQLYYEANSTPELASAIWQTASELGHAAFLPEPGYSILDDHIPFLERGIPAVDIIDFDYPYFHTTADTIDKISPQSLAQVGGTLQRWLASRP